MEIPVPIAQIKLEPSGSGTVGLHGRSTPTVPQTSHEIKREMQSYMSVMKNTVGGKTLNFLFSCLDAKLSRNLKCPAICGFFGNAVSKMQL